MYSTRQKQIDKILLAGILLAGVVIMKDAKAEPFATSNNVAGGVIVLTNDELPACGRSFPYLVYSTSPQGPTLYGCWTADKVNVHVVWADGNGLVRSYPINTFHVLSPKL